MSSKPGQSDAFRIDRRTTLFGAAAAAAAVAANRASAQITQPPVGRSDVVETVSGKVQGLVQSGVKVFLGIPYADAPTGKWRFQPPRRCTPWKGVRDVTAYGPKVPQITMDLSPEQYNVFAGANALERQSEAESLVVNLWTPEINDGRKRPVMIFFHGGGFTVGSGRMAWYDGTNLARKHDVVVMTVNHRLNATGYLYLAHLSDRFADSGNAGTLDLVAALRWIRENVANFGGDPDCVTIFGESGGGAKVCTMMGVAPAKGLFHRAIAQSGPGRGVTKEAAMRTTAAVMKDLGIPESNPERLLHVPAFLLAASLDGAKAGDGPAQRRAIGPVIDGRSLPHDPFSPDGIALSAKVPLMIGSNRDETAFLFGGDPAIFALSEAEMTNRVRAMLAGAAENVIAGYRRAMPHATPSDIFIALTSDMLMRRGSQDIALRKAAAGGAPAYLYLFEKRTDVNNGLFRSPHALEIPYVFDNLAAARPMVGQGSASQPLADLMSATWVQFARAGDPNNSSIPKWLPVNEQLPTMIFADQTRLAMDPDSATRQAWGAIPPAAL